MKRSTVGADRATHVIEAMDLESLHALTQLP